MNIRILSKVSLLVCGLGFLATPSLAASASTEEPATLKVQVNIPSSWNLAPGEPLPDFIAASLSDAISQRGLALPVVALRTVEDAKKVPYLLKIDVSDWRRTIDGDFSCTFVATLRTPQGERRIGAYSDTTWAPGVLYAHSKSAYYPTRLEPIRTLVQDLEKSGLLPDTTQARMRFQPPPALARIG